MPAVLQDIKDSEPNGDRPEHGAERGFGQMWLQPCTDVAADEATGTA
jgi:hypothetical protein